MQSPPVDGRSALGLSALGDATRGAIVRLLLDEPAHAATVGGLTRALGLRQPTVSHHLKVLARAGIVDREPRGREVWYSVPPSIVARLDDWVRPLANGSAVADAVLARITDDLSTRFTGTFSRESIERVVLESHALLRERGGAARALSSSTAQFAAERLSARALEREGSPNGRALEVLFVCVQNAGRSQLASAIMRHVAGDRVRVRTAGSAPIDAIRPAVLTALDEIGVPVGGEFPKPLTDDVVRAADIVVTMGCGDACPVLPGRRYLDWVVDDPAGQPLDRVRAIRDDIDRRVRGLLAEIDPAFA